jgi:hypothetical protein
VEWLNWQHLQPEHDKFIHAAYHDLPMLAGHRAISITQRHVGADAEAQVRVVDSV